MIADAREGGPTTSPNRPSLFRLRWSAPCSAQPVRRTGPASWDHSPGLGSFHIRQSGPEVSRSAPSCPSSRPLSSEAMESNIRRDTMGSANVGIGTQGRAFRRSPGHSHPKRIAWTVGECLAGAPGHRPSPLEVRCFPQHRSAPAPEHS